MDELNYLQRSILAFFREAVLSILSLEYGEDSLEVYAFAEEGGVKIFWKPFPEASPNNFLVPWPKALSLFIANGNEESLISLIEASKS